MDNSHQVPYESLFLQSINAIGVHSVIRDDQGQIVDYTFDAVNPAFEAMTGLKASAILDKTVRQVTPGISKTWTDRYNHVVDTGEPISFEDYSAGLGKWYQVFTFRHKPDGFTTTFLDISEQKRIHEQALLDQAKYQTFFDLPNSIKLIIDPVNRRILEANPKAGEFYGWSQAELQTMCLDQINTLSAEEIDHEIELARSQQRDHFHFRHRLRSGEVRHVDVHSSPGPWHGGRWVLYSIVIDMTEVHRLHQTMLQKERLSALGEMTACLSHEIGNLLGLLFGQIQLMELEIPDGPNKQKLERSVRTQLNRTKDLIESVRKFTRDHGVARQKVSLDHLVGEVLALEAPLCRRAGIVVDHETDLDAWVEVDPTLIQQVLVNLFKNALHALEGREAPRITLRYRQDASTVVLTFADNGPGVPEEIRPRLFTPFFTTKHPTVGTGLGLSFARTIVQEMGGNLSLVEGPGAVFQMELPLCPGPRDPVL